MSKAVLFASITSGLALLASSAGAAGPAVSAADLLTDPHGVFGAPQTQVDARPTVRPMPAPGRQSVQFAPTRGLARDGMYLPVPIMQSRQSLAPGIATPGRVAAAPEPVARQDRRLTLDKYWSVGAFR